jgi:hypothetical protein
MFKVYKFLFFVFLFFQFLNIFSSGLNNVYDSKRLFVLAYFQNPFMRCKKCLKKNCECLIDSGCIILQESKNCAKKCAKCGQEIFESSHNCIRLCGSLCIFGTKYCSEYCSEKMVDGCSRIARVFDYYCCYFIPQCTSDCYSQFCSCFKRKKIFDIKFKQLPLPIVKNKI